MRSELLLMVTLLSSGCANSLSPAPDLQGTWAANFNIPGASLVLDLTQSDVTVSGSGTYAIEAGRNGILQVSGSYARPSVTLRIVFDYGRTETYAGTVLDTQHMRGTVSDSTGRQSPLSFTRR